MDQTTIVYGFLVAAGVLGVAWFVFVVPSERRYHERKLAVVRKRIAEREARGAAREPRPGIRDEAATDRDAVHALHREAFGGDAEARLVDRLRDAGDAAVSLVAVVDDGLAGHILFTPVSLQPPVAERVAGLAPMAVKPALQRRGIGSQLVEAGLARCRELGFAAVVVLGHAGYYPRFGFAPARELGLRSTCDVPAEAFMALELRPGTIDGAERTVHYAPPFSEL